MHPRAQVRDSQYGSLPISTISQDIVLKDVTQKESSLKRGLLGGYADANRLGSTNTGHISPILSSFSHWFYGGEFTTPSIGSECLVDPATGASTILGFTPPPVKESFYRHSYTLERKDPTPVDPWAVRNGGCPLDTISGDWGVFNLDGYKVGMLSGGPAFVSASPMSSIYFFDQMDTTILNTGIFKHNSYWGESKIVSNKVKNISSKIETWGKAADTATKDLLWIEEKGSRSDGISCRVQENLFSFIQERGKKVELYKNDYFFGSSFIPKIKEVYSEFDPEVLKENTETRPLIEEDLIWHEEASISQESFYLKNLDNFFVTYKLENPDNFNINSYIHLRPNGSLIISAKNGSAIEFTAHGDIVISPKKALKIQAGSSIAGLSGGDVCFIAANKVRLGSLSDKIEFKTKEFRLETKLLELKSEKCKMDFEYGIIQGKYLDFMPTERLNIDTKFIQENATFTATTVKTASFIDAANLYMMSKNRADITKNSWYTESAKYVWSGTYYNVASKGFCAITNPSNVIVNHKHPSNEISHVKVNMYGYKVSKILKINPGVGVNQMTTPVKPISTLAYADLEKDDEPSAFRPVTFFFSPWQQEGGLPVEDTEKIAPDAWGFATFNGESVVASSFSMYPLIG